MWVIVNKDNGFIIKVLETQFYAKEIARGYSATSPVKVVPCIVSWDPEIK